MTNKILVTVMAALMLTGCGVTAATQTPSTPVPTVTVVKEPTMPPSTPSVDPAEEWYVQAVRRQARSLTSDVASDEVIISWGRKVNCAGGETNDTIRSLLGFVAEFQEPEIDAIIEQALKNLC